MQLWGSWAGSSLRHQCHAEKTAQLWKGLSGGRSPHFSSTARKPRTSPERSALDRGRYGHGLATLSAHQTATALPKLLQKQALERRCGSFHHCVLGSRALPSREVRHQHSGCTNSCILRVCFQLSALHWPPNGHWVSSFNLFVLHWFMFPPILQPKALMSWTPKLHLMPWFNPQGVHMISSLLILKTVGLSLRNVTNSTTNRNKFRRNLSIPCSPWSCMVVWSHERRDKFKSANPFVHHRKQHSSFASSRVQATKIMNGFLSAEMSMNFTSGVEMTPGQSKVMSVLFDFSRPGML